VKHGVDLDAGYFVIGPELGDVSSSSARKAIMAEDYVEAAKYLHPNVVAWHRKMKAKRNYVLKDKRKPSR